MKLSKNNLIMLACAAIVVLGAGYYFFFYTQDTGSAVTTVGAPSSDAELTFTNLAGQLSSISFDASFLANARFTTLQDIRTTVVPEVTGRKDPFAPISGVVETDTAASIR